MDGLPYSPSQKNGMAKSERVHPSLPANSSTRPAIKILTAWAGKFQRVRPRLSAPLHPSIRPPKPHSQTHTSLQDHPLPSRLTKSKSSLILLIGTILPPPQLTIPSLPPPPKEINKQPQLTTWMLFFIGNRKHDADTALEMYLAMF